MKNLATGLLLLTATACSTSTVGGSSDAGPEFFDGSIAACTSSECLIAGAEFGALVTNLGAILDGGTTNLAGITLVTSFDGGARTVVVSGGTAPVLTVVYTGPNAVTATGDLNQDGVVDYLYQGSVVGTTLQATALTDSDFDGVVDEQDVQSFDLSQGYPLQKTDVVYTLDAGGWDQAWLYQGPAVAQQGMGSDCDGMAGFPSTDAVYNSVPGTRIRVIASGPGSCSDSSALPSGEVAGSLEDAIDDSGPCYLMLNPVAGGKLAIALASQPLVVGCGNSCAGVAASTDLPGGTFGNAVLGKPQRMNLNPAVMGNFSEVQQTEVLIHELLHYAGLDHDPPPAGIPQGHDRVYGCGRYCTKCKSWNATFGGSNTAVGFAWDCADCADDFRKDVCGYREFGTETDVSECAADGEGNDCPSCYMDEAMNCDGNIWKPLPKAVPGLCCAGCSNCNPGCQAGIAEPSDGRAFDSCASFPIGFCPPPP